MKFRFCAFASLLSACRGPTDDAEKEAPGPVADAVNEDTDRESTTLVETDEGDSLTDTDTDEQDSQSDEPPAPPVDPDGDGFAQIWGCYKDIDSTCCTLETWPLPWEYWWDWAFGQETGCEERGEGDIMFSDGSCLSVGWYCGDILDPSATYIPGEYDLCPRCPPPAPGAP